MNPTDDAVAAAQFAVELHTWDLDDVLDYFAMIKNGNKFGERRAEIALVRAELHSRLNPSI